MGRKVFDDVICGLLGSKTRVLATHHTQYTRRPEVDQIIMLNTEGRVQAVGSYQELLASGFDPASTGLSSTNNTTETESATAQPDGQDSNVAGNSATQPEHNDVTASGSSDDAEVIGQGTIKWETVHAYLTSFPHGKSSVSLIVLLSVGYQALMISQNAWLASWTGGGDVCGSTSMAGNYSTSETAEHSLATSAVVYASIGGAACVAGLMRQCLMVSTSLAASAGIHSSMATSLFRTPSVFFDTNPVGRILVGHVPSSCGRRSCWL